jgi:hypothetical protein
MEGLADLSTPIALSGLARNPLPEGAIFYMEAISTSSHASSFAYTTNI